MSEERRPHAYDRSSGRVGLLCVTALAGVIGLGGCDETPLPAGVVAVFGRTGMGLGEFSYPRAAALDAAGRVFVVDKSARIQCFDLHGAARFAWQTPAWDAGKPTGLGIGPDGRVYVADTHYSRVLVYSPDGQLERSFGTRGTGPGEFLLPTDVAVDRDGTIYVGEYSGNDRISRFTPAGEYEYSFADATAGAGTVARPQTLSFGPDGLLWVADACNHRICRYTREGAFSGAFGQSGGGLGELRFPYGLDWLSDGTLVVAEYGNNRLQRFDVTGKSLGTWGRSGRRPGELAYPWAVVVAPGDQIFVVDSGNNRVQVVRADEVNWERGK